MYGLTFYIRRELRRKNCLDSRGTLSQYVAEEKNYRELPHLDVFRLSREHLRASLSLYHMPTLPTAKEVVLTLFSYNM